MMTERWRRRAFGLAVACVAVFVTVLVHEAPQRSDEPRSRGSDRAADPVGGERGAPLRRDDRPPLDGPARATAPSLPRAARAAAVEFLRAFLRYEAGASFSEVRGPLNRHADPALVRALRAAPPRVPRGGVRPPRGALAHVAAAGSLRGGDLPVTATVVYDRRRAQVLLTLRRAGGSWKVATFR